MRPAHQIGGPHHAPLAVAQRQVGQLRFGALREELRHAMSSSASRAAAGPSPLAAYGMSAGI